MKIGVVTGSVSRDAGGLFHSVRELCKTLARRGHELAVFSQSDEHTQDDIGEWSPIIPETFRVLGPRKFGFAPGMRRRALESGLDVMQLHGIWQYGSVVASAWREQTKRPLIINPHGMVDRWALQHARLKKRLAMMLYEGANLRGATCFRALNVSEAASIRDLGYDAPVAVVPNGVVIPSLKAIAEAAKGAEGAKRELLFLGRLHAKKGLLELLQAWSLLRDTKSPVLDGWTLVIAGWGEPAFTSALTRYVADHGLEGSVRMQGPLFRAEKHVALSRCSAMVLASHSEGQPVAILEAWAYGKPAFMTVGCNLPEGFAHGAAIEISTNPEEIAASLETGLRDSDLADMGRKGRALAERSFAWEIVARDMEALHSWLLSRGGKPAFVA